MIYTVFSAKKVARKIKYFMSNFRFRGGRNQSQRPNFRVSLIIINENQEILLVQHKKGERYYWVLPGGRIEYGEDFAACAIREMKEETNLDVKFGNVVFLSEAIAPDRSRHIINIYATAKAVGGELRLGIEPMLADVAYMPVSELEKITLYPPVADQILGAYKEGFKTMKYLGNLWV